MQPGETLQLRLDYRPDLFDAADVEAHGPRGSSGCWRPRLRMPASRSAACRSWTSAERDTILRGWNDTAHAGCRPLTLPALFAAQAARTPDAVAVVFEDRTLSYAALDAHANRLAHHLQSLGVGPETMVGLCVERSPEMVVGLLGILKAGGAYLPLDPNYPRERLGVHAGRCRLPGAGDAVGAARAAAAMTAAAAGRIVRLDADASAIARQPATAPPLDLDPRHPAYVIYTSGSTGTPKGVVVSHGSLSNFLGSMAEQVPLTPHDRLLAVTTIGFDIAALELYLPLIGGASVVIVPRETVQDAQALAQTIGADRRHRHAGDADLVADAAGRGRRAPAGPQGSCHADRRRGVAGRTGAQPDGPWPLADQSVRPDRDHDLVRRHGGRAG